MDWQDMFNRISEARRVFDRYDADRSGYINAAELHMCLLMNGTFLWPHQVCVCSCVCL